MKTPIKLINAFALSILLIGFSSCDKDGGNPLEKPTLLVTLGNPSNQQPAGERITYSLDCAGINTLTKLKVEEQYANNASRVILDSTITSGVKTFMHAYIYHIPDTASAGQTIKLTFTLTDEKGNSDVETKELIVTASKPQISVTANKTEASASETVEFNVTASSVTKNLSLFTIEESINGGLGNTIKTENLPDNTGLYQTTYVYTIPSTMQVGQRVVLIFKITNKEGIGNFVSKAITIK